MNPANRNEQQPNERCYLQVMKCRCIVKERDLNPPRPPPPPPAPIVVKDPCANLNFNDPDLDFGEVERDPQRRTEDAELVPTKYQYQGNPSQGNQFQGYQYQGYQFQDDPYQGNSYQDIPYEGYSYDGSGNIQRRDTRDRFKRNANPSNVKWGKSCTRKFF
ncbi:uncharacterized protein LOC135843195 [Planococcus citri]|uniref:uncharacterized protein LOC135843195 n=1 Tax=Planococcus citri TaxID=170843 RepID=UPI0031F9770C